MTSLYYFESIINLHQHIILKRSSYTLITFRLCNFSSLETIPTSAFIISWNHKVVYKNYKSPHDEQIVFLKFLSSDQLFTLQKSKYRSKDHQKLIKSTSKVIKSDPKVDQIDIKNDQNDTSKWSKWHPKSENLTPQNLKLDPNFDPRCQLLMKFSTFHPEIGKFNTNGSNS